MNTTQIYQTESSPLIVQLHPVIEMTDEQFFAFCQINRELRIERTAYGELVRLQPPSHRDSQHKPSDHRDHHI